MAEHPRACPKRRLRVCALGMEVSRCLQNGWMFQRDISRLQATARRNAFPSRPGRVHVTCFNRACDTDGKRCRW